MYWAQTLLLGCWCAVASALVTVNYIVGLPAACSIEMHSTGPTLRTSWTTCVSVRELMGTWALIYCVIIALDAVVRTKDTSLVVSPACQLALSNIDSIVCASIISTLNHQQQSFARLLIVASAISVAHSVAATLPRIGSILVRLLCVFTVVPRSGPGTSSSTVWLAFCVLLASAFTHIHAEEDTNKSELADGRGLAVRLDMHVLSNTVTFVRDALAISLSVVAIISA